MTDSFKISRRDWFRLKLPLTNQGKAQEENQIADRPAPLVGSGPATGLQPIEHPPNHDGMNLADLPPMRAAVLSTDEVAALFADIGQFGSDVQLMQRANDSSRATATTAKMGEQLELAKLALVTGTVPRLQIRYRWDGSLWIDTLKTQPDGFHLVRILHAGSPS